MYLFIHLYIYIYFLFIYVDIYVYSGKLQYKSNLPFFLPVQVGRGEVSRRLTAGDFFGELALLK